MNWEIVITILISVAAVAAAYFFYGLWERRHGHDSMHEPQEKADDAIRPLIGLANPMREVESIDDINSAVGCDMRRPDGAEDEEYFVIWTVSPMGDYRFSLAGRRYCLRAAKTEEDITGVYVSDGTLTEALGGRSGAEPVMIEGHSFMRVFRGDMQYALYSDDAELRELAEAARALKLDNTAN